MHDILHAWAAQYSVHPLALADLFNRLGVGHKPHSAGMAEGSTEGAVSNRVRLLAADAGIFSWRNNVGALKDDNGRMIRYGLCNDTAALNKAIKSADLIGIKPVIITPQMVGQKIGQFWSRECKHANWFYTGAEREPAQLKWAELIIAAGGDAAFTTGGI